MQVQDAFNEIGAMLADKTFGRRFEIDIITDQKREAYRFQYPWNDQLTLEVMDVNRHLRHLVLDVTGMRLPISGRYLCGHDESHWFVAGLSFGLKTGTVRGAMESLKPEIVRREQRRKGVKHGKERRKTVAYVRQGEWFFLPRPKMHVADSDVEFGGRLARKDGKPHLVDQLYRIPGRNETFVRGRVRHVDHQTIVFDFWHRVVQNNEVIQTHVDESALQSIAWVD